MRDHSCQRLVYVFGSQADIRPKKLNVCFTPKADIGQQRLDVRFVPKADICGAAKFRLFDHLVRASEQRRWYVEAERFGSLEVVDVTRILTANEGLLSNRD